MIPNASIQREAEETAVWRMDGAELSFVPVTLGASDLSGHVQVREGIQVGDRIVVYSEKALTPRSRVHVVKRIPGVSK